MQQPVVINNAATAALAPTPITPDWVVQGEPSARAASLNMSPDKTSHIMVWDCTPGVFNWHYGEEDEVVYLLSGEVFITMSDGTERRLTGGDVAVFPAGSSCTWRVTIPVRKIAILRKHMPRPVGFAIRAWHKLRRTTGLSRSSPLQQAASPGPAAAPALN